MWPDVAGGADHQVAGVGAEQTGRHLEWGQALQTRHVAGTSPVHDLVLAPLVGLAATVSGVRFGQHAARGQHGGHRVVDIDYATPDFGMFQRKRPAETPQDGVCRVGAIAVGDRLGIAGEEVQPRWRCQRK